MVSKNEFLKCQKRQAPIVSACLVSLPYTAAGSQMGLQAPPDRPLERW